MVLRGQIMNNFSLGGCYGLERTDFQQNHFWGVMVVLKGLIFNTFHFQRMLWS